MFVSVYFPIFLSILIICFFCVRVKWRAGVLLLASYLFCAYLSVNAAVVLFLTTVLTWLFGMILENKLDEGKKKQGKVLLGIITAVYLAVLMGYKYIPYTATRFGAAENSFWTELAVPVGLSFYMFQAISYLADVYLGKTAAERRFIYFGLYMNFFAKLVSGPIERKENFISQLQGLKKIRFWDTGRLSVALSYMMWGYFLKMVVADRLAMITDPIFIAPENFDSAWLIMGAVFYTMQIYCDFAGYSYIAVGCAKIFGINLTNNFNSPYMAVNITDFWRRWHISLSTWFRDYLYIPLGGNRKGMVRKNLNIMIVFVLCGIWHGTGLSFITWGALHGLYHVVSSVWAQLTKDRLPKWKGAGIFGWLITFTAVSVAWIFFRAPGAMSAFRYIAEMFTSGFVPGEYSVWIEQIGIHQMEYNLSWIGITVVLVLDWFSSRKKEHFPDWLQHKQRIVRYAVLCMLFLVIFVYGMYGPGYSADAFIYMQF